MINIHKEFTRRGLKSKLLLQVHDELNLDVPKAELEEVATIVKSCMENAMNLKVPLTVETGSGCNWFDSH